MDYATAPATAAVRPLASEGVRDLLRRRLRIAFLIITVFFGGVGILSAWHLVSPIRRGVTRGQRGEGPWV